MCGLKRRAARLTVLMVLMVAGTIGTVLARTDAARAQQAPFPPYGLYLSPWSVTGHTLRWNPEPQAQYYNVGWWRYGVWGWNYLRVDGTYNTAWTQFPFEPGRNYAYVVQSCNNYGCSPWSAQLEARAFPPAPPSGLRATFVTPTTIITEWFDNAINDTYYEMGWWQWGYSSQWTYLRLNQNQRSYWNEFLAPNTRYSFTVRACNDGSCSPWAPQLDVMTAAGVPNAPFGLTPLAVTPTSITIGWVDNATNETGFQIAWWRYGFSSNWTYGWYPFANFTSWQHAGLEPNVRYAYTVQACNQFGCSPWAQQIDVTTPPALTSPAAPAVTDTTAPLPPLTSAPPPEAVAIATVPAEVAAGGPTHPPVDSEPEVAADAGPRLGEPLPQP